MVCASLRWARGIQRHAQVTFTRPSPNPPLSFRSIGAAKVVPEML